MPEKLAGCQETPLHFFNKNAPKKPYCTDNFALGVRIQKRAAALKSRYVQPNGPTHKYWLIFDLDRTDASLHWDHAGAPPPNITVKNPDNGHSHLLYCLEIPLRTAPDGSVKALKYAAAVETALREKLGADTGYSGLICKNPLHEHWFVTVWEDNRYSLDHLAEYLDLGSAKTKVSREYGLGRNCDLFERLRKWSYRAVRQGWPEYERWHEACLTRARAYNSFENPLDVNEVKGIAKSVAKYTHAKFSPEGFSQWQAEKGRKGGKIGGKISKGGGRPSQRTSGIVRKVRTMKRKGATHREIAEKLNISRGTVSNYLKDKNK